MATTLAAIIEKIASDVSALAPESHSDKVFSRSKKNQRLREWAESGGLNAAFRKFEIVSDKDSEDAEIWHTDFLERREGLTVTIAYPSPLKYGALYRTGSVPDDMLNGLALMRADARQIDVAIRSPNNRADVSHLASFPRINAPETDGEDVWYQTISVEVIYYESTL